MKTVSFNSATAYLLDDLPDWNSFLVDATLPSFREQGMSGLETRTPRGDTLRFNAKFSCTVVGSDLPAFRNALQGLNIQAVLCPLWPAMFQPGNTPPVSAPYYVAIGDGSAAVIHPASDLPLTRQACPLMVGRLANIPEPSLVAPDIAVFDYEFTENDPDNIMVPAAFVPGGSLTASNGTRPIFPWRPDWATVPVSGAAQVDIERRQIGQGRSFAEAYYTQDSRRDGKQAFTLDGVEVWNMLAFFISLRGTVNNFWLPMGITEAGLTADVANTDTALSVDNGAALSGNKFIVLDDLANRVALQVSSVAGSTWNLAAAPDVAFSKAFTRIESLMLARLDDVKISFTFGAADLATTTLAFKEVPYEVVGGSGETEGSTMGIMPTRAYLYVFTVKYPGATTVFRFTDFERSLNNGGNTFQAAAFEHGDIKENFQLERSTVEVKSRTFSGNPLNDMVPLVLEWPLLLQIFEADVTGSAASNLRCYFNGEVTQCKADGPYLLATAASLSSWFDRKIPRRLLNPGCNWILFEGKCGLAATDWKWSALVTAYSGTDCLLTLGTITSSNGASLVSHYFAGGYLRIGTGANVQYRLIVDSSNGTGGTIQLALSAPLRAAPAVGAAVDFFPGCDGLVPTCRSKFSNYQNFGGFPFIPAANPSAFQTTQGAGGGNKK